MNDDERRQRVIELQQAIYQIQQDIAALQRELVDCEDELWRLQHPAPERHKAAGSVLKGDA